MQWTEPTADELAALEARFGDVLRARVRVEGELLTVALMLPFTCDSFDRHFDELMLRPDDAAANCVVRQRLWPAPGPFAMLRERMPMLPGTIVGGLVSRALGKAPDGTGAARVDKLTRDTPPGVLWDLGLDTTQADALLASAVGELALVTVGGVGFVLRAPTMSETAALQRAYEKKAALAAACRTAARNGIVWCSLDIEEAFRRLPAAPALTLGGELLRLGGAGAEATFHGSGGDVRGAAP